MASILHRLAAILLVFILSFVLPTNGFISKQSWGSALTSTFSFGTGSIGNDAQIIINRYMTSRTWMPLLMAIGSPSREFQKGDGGVRRQPANLVPINNEIKADKVRVIAPGNETDDDGMPSEVMLGIFPLAEALQKAESFDLDLVMLNDKGDPPVVKIIDYGKFKYYLEKKKKENAKKQVKSEIKEVKMSYKIDDHDFDVRVRAVQRFLQAGDRVKVVVQFKGREMQHKDLGKDLLDRIYKPIEDIASMDSTPKIEGRSFTMLVGPKKDK